MRVKDEKIEINYEDTQRFFADRARKYNEENPYSVTMYQDNNKKLVEERNKAEQDKILPLLKLNEESRVIDIGCGIGRWADAIPKAIDWYLGVDFLKELIDIAKKRNNKSNFEFASISAVDVKHYMEANETAPFNRVIISGVLMYLNDLDVDRMLSSLEYILKDKAVIYIREPVDVIDQRLTLKNFYSKELDSDYSVIYRSVKEYRDKIKRYLENIEFWIEKEGFIFEEDGLNNRKETSQYFFILERS